jgi:Tol biopolymer transport system component
MQMNRPTGNGSYTARQSLLRPLLSLLALLTAGLLLLPIGSALSAQPVVAVKEARFDPGAAWPVASPVTLTVRFEGNVAFAQWQWVGADGNPAAWEGAPIAPRDFRPSSDAWVGVAPAPPSPGTYGVRIRARPSGAARDVTLTPALRGTVMAEERATRGVAYVRDRNIWLRNLDGSRERALTHYGGRGTAAMPAWSPDGRRIAYIRDSGEIGSGPDLWAIFPNGTGARRVSERTPGRSLAYPAWTPDGTLYVTESRPLRIGTVEVGETWDLMRVDFATGKRTPVIPGALTPDISPDGTRVVYVQQQLTSDGAIVSGLAVSGLEGRNERLLVPPLESQGLFAPAWSPDGKLIVFAGENVGASGNSASNFMALHGGTWDLWTVSPDGGSPTLLSAVQEELPFPRWHPDANSVLYMDPDGYFSVSAAGGPPNLIAPHDATGELTIFAPTPRPAPPLPGLSACFAATRQCVRGLFHDYWFDGSLMQLGYPITPELIEEGRTVQYTQRARFEWHPENKGTPYEVLLGRLGADMAEARAGEAPFRRIARPTSGNLLYFPETGHTVGAQFRGLWELGGIQGFGYPLSEPFREVSPTDGKEYLVQYFERNRFEYHPEITSGPNILLGLLGVQEYERRYAR